MHSERKRNQFGWDFEWGIRITLEPMWIPVPHSRSLHSVPKLQGTWNGGAAPQVLHGTNPWTPKNGVDRETFQGRGGHPFQVLSRPGVICQVMDGECKPMGVHQKEEYS